MEIDKIIDLNIETIGTDSAAATVFANEAFFERQRQIVREGFTPDHDDAYTNGELISAARYYLEVAVYSDLYAGKLPENWPWPADWWKPTTAHRNLVKALALLIAESDRIERASKAPQTMPAPDQTVLRKDGTETVAMFFYAPSEHPLDEIAAEYGFDSTFLGMEDDPEADDALYDEWDKATNTADGKPNDVIRTWHPTLGDGWKLAEKYDTEDGPIACFIRRKAGA